MHNLDAASSDRTLVRQWLADRQRGFSAASRLLLLASTFASVGLSVGCGGNSGPPLGRVVGTVWMDGDPVPGVRVVFVPDGHGSPSYGATDEDGVFRLFFNQHRAGAELGAHHVIIEHPDPQTDEAGKPIGPPLIMRVAQKYRQPGTLSAEVFPGHNEFEFEVEAEPKAGKKRA